MKEGDVCDSLYYIEKGLTRQYYVKNGKEVTEHLEYEGGIVMCIESFFLLPPPDFLLIAMDLAKPEKALFYATVCTLASAIGGAVGYAIGYWGGRPAFKFLFKKHIDKLDAVEKMYKEYGLIMHRAGIPKFIS